MLEEVRKSIAIQLNIPVDTIKVDSRLVDDLRADSLDLVELVMQLEERYNIEIPDEAVLTLKTVGDVVNYIEANKD